MDSRADAFWGGTHHPLNGPPLPAGASTNGQVDGHNAEEGTVRPPRPHSGADAPSPSRITRRSVLGGSSLAVASVASLVIGRTMAGAAPTVPTSSADLSGLPVVNITDAPFNADPTGSVDSTAALLAAIAAAGTTGRIYAPAGTFLITGAQNHGKPVVFDGDGVFEGAGSKWNGGPGAGTIFKCGDQTAGIVLNGSGMSANFTVDGNGVAITPLQRGLQQGAGSFGTFMNIAVVNSAQDGWTIVSSQNDAYYSCASHQSARDNLNIDGGAGGLDFYHWNDSACGRYGIHSDGQIGGLEGSYVNHTEAVRFWGGITEVGSFLGFTESQAGTGISRIMLTHAIDWAFPSMNIYGVDMSGPAVHVDQGTCYAINLSDALIFSNKSGGSPGQAGVQIDGPPGYGAGVNLTGTFFVAGDTSVYVAEGSPTILATSLLDHTTNGPVAAAGVPAIFSLLEGYTGPWVAADLAKGWSGTAHYRIDGLGRVELRGRIVGPSGATALTLPNGYTPANIPTLLVLMGDGVGSLAIDDRGAVVPTQLSGDTTKGVVLDGLSFPTS
jgi:hypothetical protein